MNKQLHFFISVLFLLLFFNTKAQTLNQAQEFVEQSDYNNAIQTLTRISTKAKKENNISLFVIAQNGIADCYIDLGTYYKAMSILKNNISILNKQKLPDYKLLGDTHLLMTSCYSKLTMLEDYLKECNTFYYYYKKACPDKKIYKALYFAYVGRYYNIRLQVDKAYHYTSNALKIYHNNKKEAYLVDEYFFYSEHLFTLRYYDTTYENRIAYQDSLIYTLNKRYPIDNVKKARIYPVIAAINFDIALNLYDDDFRLLNANIAIDWYNKAIKIYENKVGLYHPNAAYIYSLKAFILTYKKEYKAALENYEIAKKMLTANINNDSYLFSNSNSVLMGLLSWKTLCLSEMYLQKKDIKLLYETEKTLLAMEKVWLIYANHTFKNKQSYNTNGYIFSPYPKLTNVYHNLYEATGKSTYLEKFFENDEKSKYTALLESLYKEKNKIKQNNKTAQNRLKTCESYDDVMLSYNEKISVEKTKKEYETIFKTNFNEFNKNSIDIFNSKKINSLKEFQDKLKDNEAFISINHIMNFNYKTPYLFLITKKSTKIITLKPETDFTKTKVDNLLTPLNNNDIQAYKKVAYQYYLNYFKPIEPYLPKNINHIKISPDSNFSNLPFDLLLTEETTSSDYSQLPYLIKKYQFSYGLSSTIEKLIGDTNTNSTTFSVFSPDFSDTKLSKLNLAKKTANVISEEYNTLLLENGNASKINFKKQLQNDNVVAILSHGKANRTDDDISQKGIYLSDGFLSLSEVYNYKATTQFLILGACETGVGYKELNEGNINLARAFTSIGVKSMLLATWAIDESSSMQIINSFLKYLNNGDTKSAALQKAKLDYLDKANQRTANPLYWAGLNITGTNETIPIHQTNYYWYALVLIPLGISYVVFRKRKKSIN